MSPYEMSEERWSDVDELCTYTLTYLRELPDIVPGFNEGKVDYYITGNSLIHGAKVSMDWKIERVGSPADKEKLLRLKRDLLAEAQPLLDAFAASIAPELAAFRNSLA